MPNNYRAIWTDIYGTTYQQDMRLDGNAGHRAFSSFKHEEWVRENHAVDTYRVFPFDPTAN